MKEVTDAPHNHLSGIWRSEYAYHNRARKAEVTVTHYVRFYPKGGELVVESVPGVNESYLIVRLWLDGEVATGSWQEVTSPEGYNKGAIFHGAAQFLLSEDRHILDGKWVGFDKDMEVATGPWTFTYLGQDDAVITADQQKHQQ